MLKRINSLVIFLIILMFANSCTLEDTNNTVTDIDGNVYNTVTIGTQIWMVENLKTTKYRDGTALANVTSRTQWSELTAGAYCDYENTASNTATYGRLYNWYAVSDTRNLAPKGWHVATDADWRTLTTYLGGEMIAGGKLQKTSTTNTTNESTFSALPGGFRWGNGTFGYIGDYCYWWLSTDYSTLYAWSRFINYGDNDVRSEISAKNYGFSVRCVKDN